MDTKTSEGQEAEGCEERVLSYPTGEPKPAEAKRHEFGDGLLARLAE